ncbi:MAG: glycogen/starch synthase, partial [Candidatus Kariarchaeaceae archaeon]
MRILWVTTEMVPFAMAGGLADVSTALPNALAKRNHDVRIVLPFYSFIKAKITNPQLCSSFEDFSTRNVSIYLTNSSSEIPIYLIDHELFEIDSIYENEGMAERYALFSWVAAQLGKSVDWTPDIIHAHDWPTGPVAAFVNQD